MLYLGYVCVLGLGFGLGAVFVRLSVGYV